MDELQLNSASNSVDHLLRFRFWNSLKYKVAKHILIWAYGITYDSHTPVRSEAFERSCIETRTNGRGEWIKR